MRIIGGTLRSRIIEAPLGRTTRPTSDKTREAIFNIVQGMLGNASVLDLFAGSGALGIEALSRGAATVTFVDKDAHAIQCIKKNCKNLHLENQVTILKIDYRKLDQLSSTFDLILLDPPYQMKVFDEILMIIEKNHLLNENGVIIYETNKENHLDHEYDGYLLRQYRYGIAYLSVLKKKMEKQIKQKGTDAD